MSGPKQLEVFRPRWYVDADTLGLAQLLAQARPDVTFPGDDGQRKKRRLSLPPCVIGDPETDDDEWIPKVTREGLAIITRDVGIQGRTNEILAVLQSGARMFAITSKKKKNEDETREKLYNWDLLEIVASQWRKMEDAAKEPGPYIYSVARTGLYKINLLELLDPELIASIAPQLLS